MPDAIGPKKPSLPNDVVYDLGEVTPPLVLTKLGDTCADYHKIETKAWQRHVPEGLARPEHSKRVYGDRFAQLRKVLSRKDFDCLKEEQSSFTDPTSIFDDARMSLSTLVHLHSKAPVGRDTRLARTLAPRLGEALRAIAQTSSPLRVLAGVTVVQALVKACPGLPGAARDATEVQCYLDDALEKLEATIDQPQTPHWDNSDLNYGFVREGCFEAFDLLAPCLDRVQVAALLPIVRHEAETDHGYVRQGNGLDALAALLRRVPDLKLPEADLVSLRGDALDAIALPHETEQAGRGDIDGHAWRALHAWVNILAPDDAEFAFRALSLAALHLSPCMESRVSTQIVQETLQRLARLCPPDLCRDNLNNAERQCMDLVARGHYRARGFEDVLATFKILCLAVGGLSAEQACRRLAEALPNEAGPWGLYDFILRCAPHFDSATARILWKRAFLNAHEWGSNVNLDDMLKALTPRLSHEDASALLNDCLNRLKPTEEDAQNAFVTLEHLGTRATDRTPMALACLAVLEPILAPATGPTEDDDDLGLYYARRNLEEVCNTLGAMSEVEPHVLLATMDALLGVREYSENLYGARRAAPRALVRIVREASPSQLPVVRSFLETLTPELNASYDLQQVWSAYVSRLQGDAEIQTAYAAFARGKTLGDNLLREPFWETATFFVEHLSAGARATCIDRVLATTKDYDTPSFLRFGLREPGWARCLASIARHGSLEQRDEAVRILESIRDRAKENPELIVTAAAAAGDTASFEEVWRTAEAALSNNEGVHASTAQQTLTQIVQAAEPAFMTRILTSPPPSQAA